MAFRLEAVVLVEFQIPTVRVQIIVRRSLEGATIRITGKSVPRHVCIRAEAEANASICQLTPTTKGKDVRSW